MNLRRSLRLHVVPLALAALIVLSGVDVASASVQESARAGSATPTAQDATQLEMPTDQIIVKYRTPLATGDRMNPASAAEMQRLSDAAGVSLTYVREMSGEAHVLGLPSSLPPAEVEAIAGSLSALPEVEYAEPDAIMTLMLAPNDPLYGNQWHYTAPGSGHYGINAPAAWDITTGSSSIVVAVIDNGITDHADLSGRTVPGYDFISDVAVANDGDGRDSDPRDPGDWIAANECFAGSSPSNSSWHGTHTAGTIGAASNNSVGVAGINWNSRILPVRVLGKCGGTTSDVVDGMRWAAGLPVPGVPNNSNVAKVMNVSLGGSGACGATYQNAINAIVAAGTTVVVAAGNSNTNASGFQPASCNGVITVAATNRYGARAYYSNYGSVVEISAPGGETTVASDGILSTLNTGTQGPVADTYSYYQGTSMAAPHVTGVVSLMLSRNPALSPAQILSILQSTVTGFPGGSTCNTANCGSGIANAGAAVAAVSTPSRQKIYLPLVMRSLPPSPSTPTLDAISNADSDGNYTVAWNAASGATSYLLQEDENNSFTSPTTAYNGANTSWIAGGKPAGTYYYRVQSLNGTASSGWSNIQSVTVGSTATDFANGDFEQGRTGWTEYSRYGAANIVMASPAHSGAWVAWLGGLHDEISYIEQRVTVPAARPYLLYYHWIISDDSCGSDFGGVIINGSSVVDQYDLCTSANTGGWVAHSVNLSAYAGQSVLVQIRAETDQSELSSLYVDDVSFAASAANASAAVRPNAGVRQATPKAELLPRVPAAVNGVERLLR